MSEQSRDPDSKRSHERLPLVAEVEVDLQSEPVRGSGRNVSRVGVYFIADDEIRAKVRIGGREAEGTIVRIEDHGQGKTGIAVKFDPDAFGPDGPELD